ncbi:uncharacterized protein EI90DRAFT_3051526 [Cantharellus anzutake]|uniref:uncharacterized protein n=1 Tax=Cantharellus anzutake TaxID=1750568 RepID=UPI001908890A|nr:uncharacterized protein EI90DRAFT_3051526 [Cantharellus anzutake]KAF8334229.1 hypothetical protein EI90DRAFT_3051526 [Cantharellus anzutake]
MDALDFSLHGLILTDLARSINASTNDVSSNNAIEVISTRVKVRDLTDEALGQERAPMSASGIECNIAFGELALNVPAVKVQETVQVLIDILRDVPFIDFPQCLTWSEWSLPDQLVFTTVSSLLWLASSFPETRTLTIDSIGTFSKLAVQSLRTENSQRVVTDIVPSLHGLYRAITSTPFPWKGAEWESLAGITQDLFKQDIVDRLNSLLTTFLENEGFQEETSKDSLYARTLLSRYISNGRPLSGYFAVRSVMEIQCTALAQILLSPAPQSPASSSSTGKSGGTRFYPSQASITSWASLAGNAIDKIPGELEGEFKSAVVSSINSAMQCCADLLEQIEEIGDVNPEAYAYETLSESLKLATICCVAVGEAHAPLLDRLRLLLSERTPITDVDLQDSAIKCVVVLVRNFPELAPSMASLLRRFVTAPLPPFEFEYTSTVRAPPLLRSATKGLAVCLKLITGNDLGLSYIYSLFNFVSNPGGLHHSLPADAHDRLKHTGGSQLDFNEGTFQGYSEEQRRLIATSTVCVITRLALELQDEDITRLAISMLLQRLQHPDAHVEAAIAYNLVDLALPAPVEVFSDIVKAYSNMSMVSLQSGACTGRHNAILAAQTRLAQELKGEDQHKIYLSQLLNLSIDIGTAIQVKCTNGTNHQPAQEDIDHLSALALPIDALLAHKPFRLHSFSQEVVGLFQGFWFIAAVFRLSDPRRSNEWKSAALARIAAKTPQFVLEESHDYLSSNLEYNRSLRKDYGERMLSHHKATLLNSFKTRVSEVKHLTPAQVVFLLSMDDIEGLRAAGGLPSALPGYFVNADVNSNIHLSACMELLADSIVGTSVDTLARRVVDHSLGPELNDGLKNLLIWSCHRISKARIIASKYIDRLVSAFPSLMCDSGFVFAVLDILTLLQNACEGRYIDEFNPQHTFHSDRSNLTITLTDSYTTRKEILMSLYRYAKKWLSMSIARAPIEAQAILQKYLSDHTRLPLPNVAELGASTALQYAVDFGTVQSRYVPGSPLESVQPDRAKLFTSQLASHAHYCGEAAGVRLAARIGLEDVQKLPPVEAPTNEVKALKQKMVQTIGEIRAKTSVLTTQDLRRLLFRCVSVLISMPGCEYDLLHYIVVAPFETLTPASVAAGRDAWTWLVRERPDLEVALMLEFDAAWLSTIELQKGMFSPSLNLVDTFFHPVEYSPTQRDNIERALHSARRLLVPHTMLLQTLASRLQAVRYRMPSLVHLIIRLVLRSVQAHKTLSTHPLAREARFTLLLFGFQALRNSRMDTTSECQLRSVLYQSAFSWFAARPQWTYGANRIQLNIDVKLMQEFLETLQKDSLRADHDITSLDQIKKNGDYEKMRLEQSHLLRVLVENEISRLLVWNNPANEPGRGSDEPSWDPLIAPDFWAKLVRIAWKLEAGVAVNMVERFKVPAVAAEVSRLVRGDPAAVVDYSEALTFLLGDRLDVSLPSEVKKYILMWAPVAPVLAVSYFQPHYRNDPSLLQYAHRVLEGHPVDVTFFYVPQVVQALRGDSLGYVEWFVFETAQISQLFCHQIIWNMKANTYKDDAGEEPDPMKPMLDRMTDMVVASLSGSAREFYDREFAFFEEVTSISGTLKPFIKKTKAEKKAKIDEEMAKIRVDVGVYLPSNPDGIVVDIDKRSGRPLQSHAKAPFMATFKVRKERTLMANHPDSVLEEESSPIQDEEGKEKTTHVEIWQQAIFKVGDDCRQDVLALQVIAMFKSIFERNAGLVLYLYPYRVIATAPGCGVIDVVPNSTSRDEMGRAKINDLIGFFESKYGHSESVAFQQARLNFIQSMAAYSVACYILQIKDRHNGNIMIDGEGHIVHIDFGFLFDIGPGGVKFEPNSFKLNHEMVVLMGGRNSEGYQLFVRLTVKAFLAIRPFADQIVETVRLMLGTGLPSFKGEPTIQRLRDRFVPGMTERQAAEWMMAVIRNAHENVRSTVYDEFQRIQNGIPYA